LSSAQAPPISGWSHVSDENLGFSRNWGRLPASKGVAANSDALVLGQIWLYAITHCAIDPADESTATRHLRLKEHFAFTRAGNHAERC
jgi:hypothetical protein